MTDREFRDRAERAFREITELVEKPVTDCAYTMTVLEVIRSVLDWLNSDDEQDHVIGLGTTLEGFIRFSEGMNRVEEERSE